MNHYYNLNYKYYIVKNIITIKIKLFINNYK